MLMVREHIFASHIDIPVGPNRRETGEDEGEDRFISAV
jgi:hypothetical protein